MTTMTTHAMPAYVILLEERRRREDGQHFSHGHSRIEAIEAPRERISPLSRGRCRCHRCRLLNERSNRARMRYESFVKGAVAVAGPGNRECLFKFHCAHGRTAGLSVWFVRPGWSCLVTAISFEMRFHAKTHCASRTSTTGTSVPSRFGFSRRHSNAWETRDRTRIPIEGLLDNYHP